MTTSTIFALLSVLLVSFISLVGVLTLAVNERVLRRYLHLLVSLAVGALLGGAFIHLIPEAFAEADSSIAVSLEIIGGIVLFLVLEKFLHIHHHAGDACENSKQGTHIHPVGRMILIADGAHNFIDGIVIGAAYLVSIEAGVAATFAIILHEIPQEVSDFGVLLHAGYSTRRALVVNFLSALTAVAGTVLVLVAQNVGEQLTVYLPPLAAGSFIYIAMSDLIPEMHKNKSVAAATAQVATAFLGIGAMLALAFLE